MKSYLSLLFLVFLTVHLEVHLLTLGRIAILTPTSCYTDSFRRQKLPEELYHSMQSKDSDHLPWTDILTVTMLNGQFHPEGVIYSAPKLLQSHLEWYWIFSPFVPWCSFWRYLAGTPDTGKNAAPWRHRHLSRITQFWNFCSGQYDLRNSSI